MHKKAAELDQLTAKKLRVQYVKFVANQCLLYVHKQDRSRVERYAAFFCDLRQQLEDFLAGKQEFFRGAIEQDDAAVLVTTLDSILADKTPREEDTAKLTDALERIVRKCRDQYHKHMGASHTRAG